MSNKRQNKNRPKNPTPKFDICQVIYFYLHQQEDKVRHEGKKKKKSQFLWFFLLIKYSFSEKKPKKNHKPLNGLQTSTI